MTLWLTVCDLCNSYVCFKFKDVFIILREELLGTHPNNMATTAPPHLKSAETDFILHLTKAAGDALWISGLSIIK